MLVFGKVVVVLLVGGIITIYYAVKPNNKKFAKLGIYGFIGLIIAGIGGVGTVTIPSGLVKIAYFVMVAGFLIAAYFYGAVSGF